MGPPFRFDACRAASVVLCAAACLAAPMAHTQAGGNFHVDTPHSRLNLSFGEREVAIIRAYYGGTQPPTAREAGRGKPKGLPPGLRKKLERGGKLPPGLQKRIERGESLPPGLAKRALPADLERRLPPLPAGYGRYVVGDDVVLVDARRNVALDIVAHVAF